MASEHDGTICADFFGGDWAECRCGWRSDTVYNPTEAKLAHERHVAELAAPSSPQSSSDTGAG